MRSVATDVAWSVSVCLVVTTISCQSYAKMAEATEMPFGMWTQVGPRNHVEKSSPNGMGQFFLGGGISGVAKVIG